MQENISQKPKIRILKIEIFLVTPNYKYDNPSSIIASS